MAGHPGLRQHAPIATDTFIALRFTEVNGWYHALKVVARAELTYSQRFHKKV
jgi:hypothetical protein